MAGDLRQPAHSDGRPVPGNPTVANMDMCRNSGSPGRAFLGHLDTPETDGHHDHPGWTLPAGASAAGSGQPHTLGGGGAHHSTRIWAGPQLSKNPEPNCDHHLVAVPANRYGAGGWLDWRTRFHPVCTHQCLGRTAINFADRLCWAAAVLPDWHSPGNWAHIPLPPHSRLLRGLYRTGAFGATHHSILHGSDHATALPSRQYQYRQGG